ncbi:MAG: hypothetical protein L6407_04020, partial [Candidatus Delongbacteria bacterium]|nr:hypothetical protein [Candidatus Delongbacteria bacterium]
MIKKIFLCTLLFASYAFCDTSAFSVISLGDIEPSMYNSTGIAFTDSLVLKNHNYAGWTSLSNTSFSISASYYAHYLKDEFSDGSNYDRFTFEDISFALPFGNRHIFGVAYYPISIVDISNVTESEVMIEDSFDNTYIKT